MKPIIFATTLIVFICLPIFANTTLAETKELTDFEKESITSVREITLQLILIAMGVFALLGSFATSEERKFSWKMFVWLSFLLLGSSIIFGLLAYGNLIWMLGKKDLEIFGALKDLAKLQWFTFAGGGVLLALFVLLNIRKDP